MTKFHAPKSHPRYLSNFYRDLLVDGVKKGITSWQGLIAHGRGETFDYLIGEKTQNFAKEAIGSAAATFLLAKQPVICTNGNTAMLVSKELIRLSMLINCQIEINLFHQSKKRESKIIEHFTKFGYTNILIPDKTIIPGIQSHRRIINRSGQKNADVIFVPLEDGDRTEALIKMGKKVITVDLNPLSRTAQKATITIVDNIVRALPSLIKTIKSFQRKDKKELEDIVRKYNNDLVLKQALSHINNRLNNLSK